MNEEKNIFQELLKILNMKEITAKLDAFAKLDSESLKVKVWNN